jgi:hypothetical protein
MGLHPDYGEDLLVRLFAEGNATHYSFFVQAKATDHIDRYIDKTEQYLSFPVDVEHLEHWKRFWEPVILTVWDADSDITYWEIIQDYLEDTDRDSSRKKIHVKIPMTNVLDNEGLMAIVERTKSRFHRF